MYLRPQPPARVRGLRAAAAALLALAVLAPAAGGDEIRFVSIDQNDATTRDADERLRQELERALPDTSRLLPKPLAYAKAVQTLAAANGGRSGGDHYVARLTPYAFIAAEMLGADLEVLGTYRSTATGEDVYRSYFVVRRSDLDLGDGEPGLGDLLRYLRSCRARFVYHSKFSTSSYLLPSLYFRENQVFNQREATGDSIAIRGQSLEQEEVGSTDLVLRVADGRADFAAVWDGTKSKFDPGGVHAEIGTRLYFIPLPTALPNDLLVGSRTLDEKQKNGVRARLGGEIPIGLGDFDAWLDLNDAPAARKALGELRWLAREPPAPVTVRIAVEDAGDDESWYRQAARQAVRLAGTELVLYDDSYHEQVDYLWTLRRVRDGHLELRSRIENVDWEDLPEQVFRVSFRPDDPEDLALRLNQQIHARLHRIRYLWPYDAGQPLVIRDVPFSLAAEAPVFLQQIRWRNPQRNAYTADTEYRVRVAAADFYKFRLDEQDVGRAIADRRAIDPMSDVAHRVILLRPDEPRGIYAIYNGVFFALVAGSLLGAVVAVRRGRPRE